MLATGDGRMKRSRREGDPPSTRSPNVPQYPLIAEHGLIGDLQSAALVTTDGTIDWFCAPRFDSPSVFASLLDAKGGGRFRIAPEGADHVVKQLYFPDSAILVTRFMSEAGVGELVDFMPVTPGGRATERRRIVRIVRVVRGRMRFVLECDPRFDYGRHPHEVEVTPDGALFRSPDLHLTLHAGGLKRTRDRRGVRALLELEEGQLEGVILESAGSGKPHRPKPRELRALFDETERFWRGWLACSSYRGRWRDMVNRSAITLKLMIYEPTGAPVAAPTAALPEQVGGERNWDYRYTWVRDGSFSVSALLALGFTTEAEAFVKWIGDRIRERAGDVTGPLQIMYRVDGSPDLDEFELGHLEGYRRSAPVRIGNGAADQVQLDIYGEMVDALARADEAGLVLDHDTWLQLARTIDWLCENWDGREAGIWETRGGPQEFVYGRLMAWVAFDRAIRLARTRGRPADLQRWITERDAIYNQIMERGYSGTRKAFVQHYGSDTLDASLLKMPLVGFVAPSDPLWLSTLAAMDEVLVSDSLVYRYDPAASPDGLRGSEGTFSMCTFWYVQALARSGRLRDARIVFEKMHSYANHLGLFSEEIGPTGEQLGNFPQAFSHLAVINTASMLGELLDRAGPGDEDHPGWM